MEDIQLSIANYRKLGLEIDILDQEVEPWTVRVKQERLINNLLLNRKELHQRAKEIFHRNGIKVNILPVVYSIRLKTITLEWVENKMQEFDLNRNDLIKQTGIKKEELAAIFNERNLNDTNKALFFYYFKLYELGNDIRL